MPSALTTLLFLAFTGTAIAAAGQNAKAVELPSILQSGDTMCTSEADFDDFVSHGRLRPNSGTETCVRVTSPVRVAILSGQAGRKTMIRVTAGPMAYSIAWTNGSLPLPR